MALSPPVVCTNTSSINKWCARPSSLRSPLPPMPLVSALQSEVALTANYALYRQKRNKMNLSLPDPPGGRPFRAMQRPRRLKDDAVFAQNLDFRFQFDSSFIPSGSPDLVNQTQNIRGGRLSAVHNEIPVLWRNLRLSYSGFLEA